jgi:hypothetical protein
MKTSPIPLTAKEKAALITLFYDNKENYEFAEDLAEASLNELNLEDPTGSKAWEAMDLAAKFLPSEF